MEEDILLMQTFCSVLTLPFVFYELIIHLKQKQLFYTQSFCYLSSVCKDIQDIL